MTPFRALKNINNANIFSCDSTRVRRISRCRTSSRTNSAASSSPLYRVRRMSSGFKRRRRSALVLRRSGSRRCRYWHRQSRLHKWYRPRSAGVVRRYKLDSERITSASKTARSHRTPSSSLKTIARMLLDWRCLVGGTFRLIAFGHRTR